MSFPFFWSLRKCLASGQCERISLTRLFRTQVIFRKQGATILKNRILFSAPLLLLTLVLLFPTSTPNAHAFITGTVCIADPSISNCPSSPPTFTGSTGSQLTVAVNVQGSDNIQGFDIHVKTDPSVLNPTSFSVAGDVLSNYPGSFGVFFFGCINNTPVNGGNGCSSAVDGPGIVRVVATGLGGSGTVVPTTGLLFTITYNVVNGGSSASIGYPTAPAGTVGCDPSSVSGTTTCIQVVNNAGVKIPENAQGANFGGTPPPPPDFTISASPSSITMKSETSLTSTITLTSVNGFTGPVSLSETVTPVLRHGIAATLSPTSVTLTANGKATATLTVSASGSTSMGTYTVTVTAVGGGLTRQTTVTVTVTAG